MNDNSLKFLHIGDGAERRFLERRLTELAAAATLPG